MIMRRAGSLNPLSSTISRPSTSFLSRLTMIHSRRDRYVDMTRPDQTSPDQDVCWFLRWGCRLANAYGRMASFPSDCGIKYVSIWFEIVLRITAPVKISIDRLTRTIQHILQICYCFKIFILADVIIYNLLKPPLDKSTTSLPNCEPLFMSSKRVSICAMSSP
jgi:hypothetical protein